MFEAPKLASFHFHVNIIAIKDSFDNASGRDFTALSQSPFSSRLQALCAR
jgi:hypothetical protein